MLDVKIDYPDKVPIHVCVSRIHEQPVHSHKDDLELFIPLSGTVKAIIGYNTLIVKEGEPFIINDTEIHGLYETDEENLVLTVHIDLSYFRKYNEAAYGSFFLMAETYLNDVLYEEPVEEMRNQLLNLCTVKLEQKTADDTLEAMCADFLDFLLKNFQYFYFQEFGGRHFVNRYEGVNNQAQAYRIRSLMYYIWDNYDQKITLKEYADKTYINMYYLSHMIKTSTGLNFQDLLNFTRVEQSEVLLLETDRKISQIAHDCGFSATRYFEKYFKSWFQVSHEEYRRRNLRRLSLPFSESTLTPAEAITAINDFSSRGHTPPTERTSFYTDVIEIDVAKKAHKRKDPFLSIIAWDYSNIYHSDYPYKDLDEMASSFRFCAPIRDAHDLNDRLKIFLQEDETRALLLSADYISSALHHADQYAEELIGFCKDAGLTQVNVYFALPDNASVKNVRRFADNLSRAGKEKGCKVIAKEYIRCRFDQYHRNYFLDSVYAVPWIIRGCLDNTHGQEVINTVFDNCFENMQQISGGCGIITDNGIRKPSFYAYQLLSMLGRDVIYDTEGYTVTRKGNDIVFLFYDYDPEMLRKIDDYSDWNRLSVFRFASKRHREYKLDIANLDGKYNVTGISINSDCCVFSKMTELGMPDMISVEDEVLLRDYLKPEISFTVIDSHKESSILDIHVPRFGALCLKFHRVSD